MSTESDPTDMNSGFVNAAATNEANIGVRVGQSGHEILNMDNQNQGLCAVGGIRVCGEGNDKLGEGLRVQLKRLDVEIDLDSGGLNGQIGFSGYHLGLNVSSGHSGQKSDVRSAENLVGDESLVGKNESVPRITTVKNGYMDINRKEQMIEDKLKNADGIGVRPDALVRERRRKEEEGKFYVSDLVWCKVRTHPWWPGQIFEPSAASDRAMKYYKKDKYLVACFGDQTFAWSEASCLKPFRMYFSELEKQRNSEDFSHAVDCALDEVSRRVEFGLACPCLPEETCVKMKYQIAVNTGIREESSISVGGDNFSGVTSFNPASLVRFLKSVAAAPLSGIDRLSFVIKKAQLVAFNRWNGYYELPVTEEFCKLDNDNDVETRVKTDTSNVAGESSEEILNHQGTSTKHPRHMSDDEKPVKKEKLLSDLMSASRSGMPNDLKKSRGRAGQKLLSDLMSAIEEGVHKGANQILKATESSSQKRIGKRSEKSRNVRFGHSVHGPVKPEEQLIPEESPPPKEMLSKLYSAARDPMKGYSILSSLVGLFCYYKTATFSATTKLGDLTETTEKHVATKSSNSVSAETLSLGGIEDSYWTDRIIQSNSEDLVLFEPEVQNQEEYPNAKWETFPGLNPSFNNKQDDFPDSKCDLVDGNPEYSPTALILNFSDLESIHPIADLNRIFSQYGPLNESETDILGKRKRAKIVFKRRADAETAFSKPGKFSIFGPSLLSYRLDYSPSPRKASCTSKRKRKHAAVNGF